MLKQLTILTLLSSISMVCIAQENQLDDKGRRDGYWKVNFEGTSNPKFEGNFEHGKEKGTFKFYKKGFYDHPAAIMEFSETMDSVHVTYYTQTGKSISEGMMLNKKREGEWLYYHQKSDNIMMTETYKNDNLHGFQKTYFTNGQLAEKTNYIHGNKDGISLIFADNGQVTKELQYENGQLNGPAIYYDPKGVKLREGFYTNGEKSGHWKFFNDGELDTEEDY